MSKKSMTAKAASRIQAHADKSGTNQDFKARAQTAAAKASETSQASSEGAEKGTSQGKK